MKKLFKVIALNLVIGNIVAWFLGAAPIEFAKVPYSAQEQQLLSELKDELAASATDGYGDDASLHIQLGSIYSMHNQLELAEKWLTEAVIIEDNNPVAIAWLSATRAKQAGAMIDPLMGLNKLYRLHAACDDLNQAVAQVPNSFEVRMVRLATFAPTALINCSLEQAFEDEQWFKSFFAEQGQSAPLELKMQFSLSMSKAYANAGGSDNYQLANQYMLQFKQISQGVDLTPTVKNEFDYASKLLAKGS